MGKVKRLVADNPLVIFSKKDCYVCDYIKFVLRNFGANPTIYELDEIENGQQVEEELLRLGPSVPVVFIGKKLIGGSNEVLSLGIKGELKPLLIEAKAIWI
ncbi:unnamed protein product [Lactuca saligna]|uniref:Glutaredoxin domain-containing protein n=1 Tax=Lactuca saligna TaxID=75948 RepID=A0AA35ZI17_LACSI|nr:unnamed protein product [Lactuca saligna]